MPLGNRARSKRFGMLGTVRGFVSIVKELSFDDVRAEAELAPRLLVLAPDESAAAFLGRALCGDSPAMSLSFRPLNAALKDLGSFDAVVVHDPERTGAIDRAHEAMPSLDGPAPVFAFTGADSSASAALADLRATMMHQLSERAPAFGRACPPFRAAAAKVVIDETSKANAQFALVSNIPSVVPVVGALAAASADFLVLTKNQVMMFYKIGAIHGRDLRDQWGILREIFPVVGAGFVWRTLAREAASFVPLAAGTIPKVVIAYAGTLAAGRAADFYFRLGKKPSREQMLAYYRQGAEAVKKLPLPGRNGNEWEESGGGKTALSAAASNRNGELSGA